MCKGENRNDDHLAAKSLVTPHLAFLQALGLTSCRHRLKCYLMSGTYMIVAVVCRRSTMYLKSYILSAKDRVCSI